MTDLTPAVSKAIDAVREHFTGSPVQVFPDGAGGADVIVENVAVGARYTPTSTWLGFQLNAAYPNSDIYPHYVGVLTRADGQPHGGGIQQTTWRQQPCLQLSRRSQGWNTTRDNAVLKAEKVLTWLTAL